MKKLLGLFVVLAVALPASADVLKNVELKGEIQTIASDVNHNLNVPPNVYNDNTRYRVLAGLSADLVEDVTTNLTFQHVDGWIGTVEGDNLDDYQTNTRLAEANVVLSNLFDRFELTVGRQFYGEESSAVMYFGPNHYNAEGMTARSLEAAKLTYADDVKALTVIAGKLDVSWVYPILLPSNGAFYGVDFRMNLNDQMNFQVYGYDFHDVDLGDSYSGFYGAKFNFAPEAFLLSAEYARNFGGDKMFREHADTGYMIKVDGKVNVEEFAVRGAFLYENENFWAFGNYTPGLLIGHVFGGQIGDYSGEGVRMFNVGFDVNPFEKWTFSLDGYSFQDRFGRHSATFEGDLTAKYQHNEYVQLFAGVGYAKYGTDEPFAGLTYKDAFDKDNYKTQIGMLINF